MTKQHTIRILAKGGILTPGYLKKILQVAKQNGNKTIHFGSRQDVIFRAMSKSVPQIEHQMNDLGMPFEWKNKGKLKTQNIVSSYVANGILKSTRWVNEGAYLYILENFTHMPKIRINIIDPQQNLIPLFNGFLNFIASEKDAYWYLYINNGGKSKLLKCPFLINSTDIPKVSEFLDGIFSTSGEIADRTIFEKLSAALRLKSLVAEGEPNVPRGFFPYYEGLNKMESGKDYWAGFYWRNNEYSINFLEEVCRLCSKTNIAKISITPWKTFLVKDIRENDRILWEQLIGKYGINMRHSSFELNWHLPLLDKKAFQLKQFIVKYFDKIDVRTFGLSFSIDDKDIPDLYTSIHIRRRKLPGIISWIPGMQKYDVDFARNFNSNSLVYKTYNANIPKRDIPNELIELSRKYYNTLHYSKEIISSKKQMGKDNMVEVYQCRSCFSVYHSLIGDELNHIEKGTPFNDLPESYSCYTCGADKGNFEQVKVQEEFVKYSMPN